MSTTVEEIEKTETSEDKKSELLLDSLEIKGYRCFEHLTIEKLGRVNLIVGKNNVGKTAFLEAINIYVNKGTIPVLINSLEFRNEAQRGINQSNNRQVLVNLSFLPLFTLNSETNHNPKNTLFIKGHLKGNDETLTLTLPILREDDGKRTAIARALSSKFDIIPDEVGNLIEVRLMRENSDEFDLEYYNALEDSTYIERKRFVKLLNVFIRVGNFNNNQLLTLWDETNKNNQVTYAVDAIRLIENSITDVSFIGVPSGSNNLIPYVGILGEPSKLPLRRFGDGMARLLGLAMALSTCRNGILLVDEVESGLHYSVLSDVWKLIFKTAKDLNVQVFATTHSKDCIEAFAQAAYNSPEEGMLIRLERQGEKIVAKTIEEEMLVDAVNYEVEVR